MNTYSCSASGFSFASDGCSTSDAGTGSGSDAHADSGCSCTGTGPDGGPVTAACGASACGDDDNTYMCTASGFSYESAGCPSCSCTGTGPGGVPVTAACGQTACGDDENTYSCSASGFEFAHDGCAADGGATVALTVYNYLDWCSLTAAGQPIAHGSPGTTTVSSLNVAPGAALTAVAVNTDFEIGTPPLPFISGTNATTDNAGTASTTLATGATCVFACCPFAAASGQPAGSGCAGITNSCTGALTN
jgi:hypothetical protein